MGISEYRCLEEKYCKLAAMSRRILVPFLTIVALTGAVAGSLFLSSSPTSWDDGLRHITMARVMRTEGIDQTWSRFFYGGYLADHSVDPWFLADVFYIPFTFFSDPVGLRVYSIVGFFALLLAVWRLIAPLRLPLSWQCALLMLMAVPPEFILRTLLGRPFIWCTVFALLTADAVLRKRPIVAGVILCVATLYSHLFFFPLFFAGIGVVWNLLEGRRRSACILGLSVCIGTAVGLALHPHAGEYIYYLFHIFLQIPFAPPSLSTPRELTPTNSSNIPLAILAVSGLCFAGAMKAKSIQMRDVRNLGTPFIFALIVPLLGAYLIWARSIDFLWPLLIVLLAHVLVLSWTFSSDLFAVSMKPHFPRLRGGELVLYVIALASFLTILRAGLWLQRTDSDRSMDHVAVLQTLPDGSRMLNPEWSLVPPLMATNPRLKFVTGFDNIFLRKANPEAFDLLEVYFSLAAQIPHPVIDIHAWMSQILEMYPSDYLVVSQEWAVNLLLVLYTTDGLQALTESGAMVAVFAIDAEKFRR